MPSSAILIICMQLIIVPLTTLRTTFMVKGRVQLAAAIGGVEALVYVISLGVIFSDLTNYVNMVAYAAGYAGGLLLGGRLEKALAVGYRTFNVSITERDELLIQILIKDGFGVTVFEGMGRRNEKRYRLDILVRREREKELIELLERKAPKAFIVAYEPTNFRGGYLVKSMKKQTLREWMRLK